LPRLIINADDFGLTTGVNRAIADAGRSGGLTSATIMANARAFPETVAIAKNLPGLGTGCHVVLIDGEPLTGNLPSLAPSHGLFRSSLKDFAHAAWQGKIAEDEVQREVEAQVRKIQSTGVAVTHVDSHKHTHMFPSILRPMLRAARACGVRAVRNPFEPRRTWPAGLVATTPGLWLRSAGVAAFGFFGPVFRKAIQEEGMVTTDGTVGIAATGMLDQKVLLAILRALPEGIWELVCHPGYADDDLRAAGTRLVQSRQVELEALTSRETKLALRAHGISLISYADLKHS
jgi:hopanoid biosynthesis associated protein HpnK